LQKVLWTLVRSAVEKLTVGYEGVFNILPIPVAARSEAWVCGRSLAGTVGSNPAGGMDVSRECCVLSGSLCVRLITRLTDSECDRESSTARKPRPTRRCCAMEKKNLIYCILLIIFLLF
jgi:hypothetical protein